MLKKIFTLFLSFCCLLGFSQKKESSLTNEINAIIQTQIEQSKIPGAVIQIKKGNKTILKKAYGFAQLKDFNGNQLDFPEKTSINHLYDIASLTKVIGTTTSIMLLVDAGKINMEDKVGKYIQGFNQPDKKDITIRHLLTHTSGLYDWYPLYYRCKNKGETFKFIEELPLKFPIGEGRHYSDLGFTILGEIIEKISNKPLNIFMEENIFQPLKMSNTTYKPNNTGRKFKIAATSHGNPYEKRMVEDSTLGFKIKGIDPNSWNGWRKYTLKGEVNDGNTWYANEGISGAAGIFSTIDDIQKLVDVLRSKGKNGSKQFISEKTLNLFLTKDKFKNGLGWMMDNQNAFMKNAKEDTFGHTGFTGTSITISSKDNISIVLLINRQNMGLQQTKDYYNVNPIREQVFNTVMKYYGE
ncbi:serine hydrolase domain-containing protein [Emticicia sp. SJ17W-69]|uniref:serine hydrolase domain-containing protein n=1 Tax=Emticicia sp. SJ17W-69 TaxID=3421657 RepID=UPI003EC09BA3